MFYDHYLVVPDYIRNEVEYAFSHNPMFKGIKNKYFSATQEAQLNEQVLNVIGNCKYDNDVLLLCDMSCPMISVQDVEYPGYLKVHRIESIHSFFIGEEALQEHKKAGAFIAVAGWLEKWQYNLKEIDRNVNIEQFKDDHSYVLILDTGIHSDLVTRAEDLSKFTGIPVKVLGVGMEHFNLSLENMILRWDLDKKKDQLKRCNRKVSSYAMSIDFIKEMADYTDESIAIDSICGLFTTMFAPKNVFYHSFYGGEFSLKNENIQGTDRESIIGLKDSDANYIVFDSKDGFAIKISNSEETLGIVEVLGVAFPEHLNEYLSVGYDLAKASGLAISNIRRYHELFRSREEEAKLAEMLRTTNRILRHDIANDLQVITGALGLFEETNDEKFISMVMKAAQKSVSLIKKMRELDMRPFHENNFEMVNVKSMVEAITSKHNIEFNVNGDCMAMADKAMSSVIDNIISNAIVHGRAGKMDIGINMQNDKCTISFADDGIGIPERIKPNIFDEGFKYGATGNTGFGLFIVRKIVEGYKGSIHVKDNFPSGTVFVIELPSADMVQKSDLV
ncbi:MAG: HAMP domain-containing sensor histidine kinase [Methanolobus sp.]|nr:HAMP domain-containing sensor histidine kinase [Methanolobus sp.]